MLEQKNTQIAFITYETPFAPCGGVAAVMGRLPGFLLKATDLPTSIITPFHYKIKRTTEREPEMEPVGRVAVPFDGKKIAVQILRLEQNVPYYFLKVEDRRFFSGQRHPYDVEEKQEGIFDNLTRDGIFFGVAASLALPEMASQAAWILLMQDWEAATVALAMASQGTPGNKKLFLTLHNSYDSGASDAELQRFGIDPGSCPGETVLRRALPVIQDPVFTVSDQFALDLTGDVLQAEVIAPHLQQALPSRLVGINNGVFADLAIQPDVLDPARSGDYSHLKEWKRTFRGKALEALENFIPTIDTPVWGDLGRFGRDEVPWFVLAGRDDTRQKGYDVACSAIHNFLGRGGEARFLFFPIPSEEGLPGLGFLRKLAERFPENVLALPFIFKEGYFSALRGATYAVMPSYYEPFGMANEFYMQGTVGIGRATGGILQQIIPLRTIPSFTPAVQARTDRWYGADVPPTGLLYREMDNIPTAVSDWQAINTANYNYRGGHPDRLEQREQLPLFREMARELEFCIEDAVRIYREQPELYWSMLVEGTFFIQNNFTWERTAEAYARYLES